jgi:hypothetical protein
MSVVPARETLWATPSSVTVYSVTAGQSAPGAASAKPAAGDDVGDAVGADDGATDGATDGASSTAGDVHAAQNTIAAMRVDRTQSVSRGGLEFH